MTSLEVMAYYCREGMRYLSTSDDPRIIFGEECYLGFGGYEIIIVQVMSEMSVVTFCFSYCKVINWIIAINGD